MPVQMKLSGPRNPVKLNEHLSLKILYTCSVTRINIKTYSNEKVQVQ